MDIIVRMCSTCWNVFKNRFKLETPIHRIFWHRGSICHPGHWFDAWWWRRWFPQCVLDGFIPQNRRIWKRISKSSVQKLRSKLRGGVFRFTLDLSLENVDIAQELFDSSETFVVIVRLTEHASATNSRDCIRLFLSALCTLDRVDGPSCWEGKRKNARESLCQIRHEIAEWYTQLWGKELKIYRLAKFCW